MSPRVAPMSPILIAVVASILAIGAVVFLCVRLVQSLVLYRLMRTVKSYPNIAMALALAAHSENEEDMIRFRDWVARSVEDHGWAKTDSELSVMLARLYPLGAMSGRLTQSDPDS